MTILIHFGNHPLRRFKARQGCNCSQRNQMFHLKQSLYHRSTTTDLKFDCSKLIRNFSLTMQFVFQTYLNRWHQPKPNSFDILQNPIHWILSHWINESKRKWEHCSLYHGTIRKHHECVQHNQIIFCVCLFLFITCFSMFKSTMLGCPPPVGRPVDLASPKGEWG